MKQESEQKKNETFRYAGLTGQFLGGMGVALYCGYKLDEWLDWGFPLWVWLLPLLFITGTIIKIIKETGKKS